MTLSPCLRPYPFLLIALVVNLFPPPAAAHDGIASVNTAQCTLMQEKGVLTLRNPVPCDRLTQVSFRYVDFQGHVRKDGRVVVLDVVAPQVKSLFAALLARGFPLHKAQPLEHYAADDEASMQDNNTSAFNGRALTGGTAWSKHAYGVAIDLNPVQNPYIVGQSTGTTIVLPPAAVAYYPDRHAIRPGMAEAVLDIFFRHGFLIWGGNWKQPVDYQHFEIGSRDWIARLLALPLATAQAQFRAYGEAYADCMQQDTTIATRQRQLTCAAHIRR